MEYQFNSIFQRVQNQACKYLDICTILNKLQEQGVFEKFYQLIYQIFEKENQYTISELNRLQNDNPSQFNFQDHYKMNSQIFKYNFSSITQIIIDDVQQLFSNHLAPMEQLSQPDNTQQKNSQKYFKHQNIRNNNFINEQIIENVEEEENMQSDQVARSSSKKSEKNPQTQQFNQFSPEFVEKPQLEAYFNDQINYFLKKSTESKFEPLSLIIQSKNDDFYVQKIDNKTKSQKKSLKMDQYLKRSDQITKMHTSQDILYTDDKQRKKQINLSSKQKKSEQNMALNTSPGMNYEIGHPKSSQSVSFNKSPKINMFEVKEVNDQLYYPSQAMISKPMKKFN